MSDLDPATLEILDNRYHQISREAGTTLLQTAESATTVQARDLGFNIATPTGDNVVFSVWMPRHGTTLSHMIRSSIDQLADDPGIGEGDMILTNDPHAGALHIMDVAVLAPVHYEGELIAWAGCATHHRDVGAPSPGWSPLARDWYQEGVKFPPIKIMEGGEIREDVFDTYLRNVRYPKYQGLDLKGQIAANNVSRRRILETVDDYGPDIVTEYYDRIIDHAEQTARETIEALPDGTYTHTDIFDFDDLYRVECTLTVDGDEMTFDFSGSSEQAPSFINCAYPCAEANLHNILMVTLFPDATVNAGTFEPIDVEIPEGSIFNCTPPNPCGGASVYAGWSVMSLTNAVLSKALAETDENERASAEWGGGSVMAHISGTDTGGESFLTSMAPSMLGGGARYTRDGEHTTNVLGSTNTSMPNVEFHERRYPFLFLERSLRKDSSGAGRFRGGLAGEQAFTPYGVDRVSANVHSHRNDVPPFGLFGGLPGATVEVTVHDEADGLEVAKRTLDAQNAEFTIDADEILYVKCPGGGGIGDPLDRDPEEVLHDVRNEIVSEEYAADIYGVVVDPDGLSIERTKAARARLLEQRKEESDPLPDHTPCGTCGGGMGIRYLDPHRLGLDVADDVTLEEYSCQSCGGVEDVRVVLD